MFVFLDECGFVSSAFRNSLCHAVLTGFHWLFTLTEIITNVSEFQDKRISRRFGYSFRGYRAHTQRWYGNWGPRITAIPVICTEGIIDLSIRRGNTNEEKFLEFVNEKLVPNLQPFDGINPRSVVVMGNNKHSRYI